MLYVDFLRWSQDLGANLLDNHSATIREPLFSDGWHPAPMARSLPSITASGSGRVSCWRLHSGRDRGRSDSGAAQAFSVAGHRESVAPPQS